MCEGHCSLPPTRYCDCMWCIYVFLCACLCACWTMYRQHLSKDPYQGSVQHVLAWNITPSSQTQGIRGVICTLSSDTETSFTTTCEQEYHTLTC